jgi:hypothetical protein
VSICGKQEMGKAPKCTIINKSSNESNDYQLKWDEKILIPLDKQDTYFIIIKRPSDFISFKAKSSFLISADEVVNLTYKPPILSFMAGTIEVS